MPSISHHWVRLDEQHLGIILDGPRDQEDDETDEEYIGYLHLFAGRVGDLVETGLETW